MQLPALPRLGTILGIMAGFFAVGFLIYAASLNNEFVRWDDGMLIYENPAIRAISPFTIRWIFTHFDPELYIPLTFFTYQIDYLIGGIHPFQYHLDNLVLHILNACLIAFLLFALIKKEMPVSASLHRGAIALFCGLLFLVHPLNTESVEWASGRKDVLSTFFLLASIAAYFFYQDAAGRRSSRRWYIGSIVLFLLGLLSKVMIITLPVLLLLFDWVRGRKMDRMFFLDKIPYFVLSIVFGLVGVLGKEKLIINSSMTDKLLMASKSMLFYIQQFVWPFRFSLLYPYDGTITITSPDFFVPMIVMLALLLGVLLLLKRQRLMAVGFFFYVITVAPTLLNFSKGEMDLYFASDRYAYVPQIGFIIIIACALAWAADVLGRTFDRKTITQGGLAVGVLLLVGLGALSYKQSLVWANTQSLFNHVIKLYPGTSYVAYNNLCNASRLAGQLDRAMEECKKSLEIRKNPKTYSNLGAIQRKQKDYTGAIATYKEGIALDPASPYPHFGIGIVFAETGQYDKAEIEYLKAIGLKPEYRDPYVNLGALYAAEGKYEQAIEQYNKALAIDGFNATTYFNLAVAEESLGKTDDAMRDYMRSLQVDANQVSPRINLALLLHNAGRTEDAITQFRTILLIDPDNAAAHSALRQLGEE